MAGPLRRVLVANRGEIALRVIRACRELGLETVAVHSEADSDSLPVRAADQAVCIGHAPSAKSYLDPRAIVGAALAYRADAIHPGYGFLSEKAAFAELCAQQGITFVGPDAGVIAQMGDKIAARRLAKAAGVPTTPGSEGAVADRREAMSIALDIGFPVLLKAAAGGGGRGMRIVTRAEDLERLLGEAMGEAAVAFGDPAIYVERYLTNVRHIEIQVLGDGEHVVHLGERDCSIQRRNQKLVEEAPSPVLDAELRRRIGESAVALCRQVGYKSAGTIEYILDQDSGEFYFMEMNTRIQVEHAVTEQVTGMDLVKEQIRVAAGEHLSVPLKEDFKLRGHAIEFRINAEDPVTFAPNPGKIRELHLPGGPGVRIDTAVYRDYVVPPHYDSLIAKLIVTGKDRAEAIARGRRALEQFVIEGVKTTIPLHRAILNNEKFVRGDISTRFMEEFER